MTSGCRAEIGKGVYHLSEVARYTDLRPGRVRSWFRPRSDRTGGGPLFCADYRPVGEDYAVSFLDLIDVLIAGRFRDCGVKMRVVRSAYQLLGRQLGTNHPFCHNDLYTDGRDIFLRAADSIGDETLSEVITRQQFFVEILLPHLKRIEYSDETSLARRWQIFNGVVIDPEIAFGKPILSRTNTTTYVVASAYYANNEDVPLVADLFDLTEEDVRSAVAFEAEYGVRHAA